MGGGDLAQRLLDPLPAPLRCKNRSMLCVPIIVQPNMVASLPEGITAVMQWRNHAGGGFHKRQVKRATEWASIAAPALCLAGTNAQRLQLEERVSLANAKRDALLATAKILGRKPRGSIELPARSLLGRCSAAAASDCRLFERVTRVQRRAASTSSLSVS